MLTRRAFPALFLLTLATVSLLVAAPDAQRLRDSQRSQSEDWCARERYNNSDREQFCEVRQYTVPASGTVSVNAEPNGGIDVQGESRGDVLVQAKVTAQAETQARAKQIADSVRISTQPDISADGPSGLGRREGWSVSYRLAVPSVASLSLKSTNGGISIRDVDGQIDFRTVNGGVRLVNLAGDVKGRTSNGGVDVDLDGPGWKGEGLSVETSNGGVTIKIPEQYSAHLQTSTINGGMNIDFPLTVQGRIDREINANLGAGGAPIRVTTHNGGVKISRK